MAYSILKRYKLKSGAFEIFSAIKGGRNCFFLDSGLSEVTPQRQSALGRYSYLGSDPFYILRGNGVQALARLKSELARYNMPQYASLPPFLGGAVGFFSYELGTRLEEKTNSWAGNDLGVPECFFGFYNSVLIIDHFKHNLYISCTGFPEKSVSAAKKLAEENLKNISASLRHYEDGAAVTHPLKVTGLRADFRKNEYLAAVRRAKDYIRQGDIYQVNLSQRFEADVNAEAFEIYRRLRRIDPTYFGAYFDAGDFQVISVSPERFLKLENGRVSTRPMKGTRPRSRDGAEDRRQKDELIGAEKDLAELMMIVDLERNDLGRACSYNSIKVDTLRELEEYATVYQTTATVSGRLHPARDRLDLLRACFPGGSITGCPKIRAMEVIKELERAPREIYTGALGYLGFSGSMDLNILIRTILKIKSKVYFHVGGGIVADSRPADEYRETLVKARAMLDALGAGRKTSCADGVFETMRCHSGRIPFLKEHLARLRRSCELLKINMEHPPEQLRQLIHEKIRSCAGNDMRLRVTAMTGNPAAVMVSVDKYTPPAAEKYRNGFNICSALKAVRPLGRCKLNRRDKYEQAFDLAKKNGFDEALILDNQGYLSETTRSNIFFVKAGSIFTPSLNCGCLDGITRRQIIRICRSRRVKIKEGNYTLDDLRGADEAFLTNSLIGVMPLTSFAGREIGNRCRPITEKIIRQYRCHSR